MQACALLPELKLWFEHYTRQFVSDDPLVQANTDLKINHTRRVCAAAKDIGTSENLSAEDLCLVEMAALLHDIGRFEQYRKYHTFVDARSVDHAALGVKVLKTEKPLKALEKDQSDTVLRVVQYHNRATLPADEDERFLLLLKLVRDADKIDIWHIVTEYYQNSGTSRNPGIELDLPDEPEISDGAYDALMKGDIVRTADLKTLNDFKLLQLGWIYDLNFPRTYRIVRERGYIEKIHMALPGNSRRVDQIIERVQYHLTCHCPSH